VSKIFRPWEPTQPFLLPPSPLEWLPENHLARFILDVVAELDLSPIFAHYERQLRGQPPHHPRMMVAVLLYAYCSGVPSSRKIEERTYNDVGFRVLTANTHPDHTCISEFRRIHLSSLSSLFVQALQLCERAGLVKLGVVALDGTKLKANASKHKAMSYGRMKEEEEKLAQKVAELMKAAEAADEAEDTRYGKNRHGDDLPEQLRRAEERRARIRALREELEAEKAQQAAERAAEQTEAAQVEAALTEMNNARASRGSDDEDQTPRPPVLPEPMPSHQVPTTKTGEPTDKAQRNMTDAQSRIVKTPDGFMQGYNGQAVVDAEHQIIVAQDVSNQSPDAEHFIPMLDRTVANCGRPPAAIVADTGYFSEENAARASARGVDAYIATKRDKHGAAAATGAMTGDDGSEKTSMKAKLSTVEGAAIYSRRKVIVEPVFGQIKNRGFRGFLLRGLPKVRGEWSLITLTHNLLKLYRAVLCRRVESARVAAWA
jgi:transposase